MNMTANDHRFPPTEFAVIVANHNVIGESRDDTGQYRRR